MKASLLLLGLALALPIQVRGETDAVDAAYWDGRDYIPRARSTVAITHLAMNPGLGWRSDLEEPVAQCVDAETKRQPSASDQSVFRRVETKDEVNKFLSISASASGKYSGAQGSAAYNMSRSLDLNEETVYLIGNQLVSVATSLAVPVGHSASNPLTLRSVSGEAEDAGLSPETDALIPDVALTETAIEMIKNDTDRFFKQCGDSYVTSVVYGGQQVASFALRTNSRKELAQVTASLSGSFGSGGYGGSASVTSNSWVKKFSSNGRLVITVFKTGAVGGVELSLEGFSRMLTDFATNVANNEESNETAILVTLRRYDELGNWPDDLKLPSAFRSGIALAQEQAALASLVDVVQRVQDEPDMYWPPSFTSEDHLRSLEDEIAIEQNAVREERQRCSSKPSACSLEGRWIDDYSIRSVLPVQKSELSTYSAWVSAVAAQERIYRRLAGFHVDELLVCPHNLGLHGMIECSNLVRAAGIADKRFEIAWTNLDDDLREVSFRQWLLSENRLRCGGDEQKTWGCVRSNRLYELRRPSAG